MVFTGIQLWIMPFLSFLEGCHQVAQVFFFRFLHGVFSAFALWLALSLHANLWVAPISVVVGVFPFGFLTGIKYRRFFSIFFTYQLKEKISWSQEIWPMQWRLALSGMVNYFAFSLFNPVMFHYHGAVVAGQM